MTTEAFVLVDAQRGFMPIGEGDRDAAHGFGELAVPEGDQIIQPVNALLRAFAANRAAIITTQDWHPKVTAHFSDNPNFQTDWPQHCVDGTLGAEIDPEIELPGTRHRFIKGFEPLERGEDDTSYSGYNAIDPITDISLPEYLRSRGIKRTTVAGLALEHCVKKTAIDFKVRMGLDVDVVLDASRGIVDERIRQTLEEFDELGIKVTTSEAVLSRLALQGAAAAR